MPLTTEQLEKIEGVATSEMPQPAGVLHLAKYQLIEAWEMGVINTDSYIYLALKFLFWEQRNIPQFDIDVFIEDWQGTEGEKPKTLNRAQVLGCLGKLEKKGACSAQIKQLSLDFMG
jgi:hypothetical protein